MLLQKTFCTDFFTKIMKINEGEVPQYYVENSNPAIVSAEMFDMVQEKFLHAFNQLIDERDFITKDIKSIVGFVTDAKAQNPRLPSCEVRWKW